MSVSTATPTTACYSVTATVDPGLLPRLLGHVARLGAVPSRLHQTAHEDEMIVDLQVDGLSASRAALLENRLAGTIGVRWVGFSRKGFAEQGLFQL